MEEPKGIRRRTWAEVDLDAIRGAEGHVKLENAGFVIHSKADSDVWLNMPITEENGVAIDEGDVDGQLYVYPAGEEDRVLESSAGNLRYSYIVVCDKDGKPLEAGNNLIFASVDDSAQNEITIPAGVPLDGNGHTISNLKFIDHDPEQGTPASEMGSGFVGVAVADMTFQNLTIDTATVTAYERAVGCFVGVQTNGYIWFENCYVKNFTADGWVDYNNQDRENGGHPISFRLAGFVGHNMAGQLGFMNCHVENIKLSGFHNMAGFVGYGSATLDEFAFEECSVKNAEFTFSYCLSDAYTVDMPRKFVSVFFNHCQWVDKVEATVEMGNTFEGVSYYDWTDDNAEYTPADFRSWTDEEANAGA